MFHSKQDLLTPKDLSQPTNHFQLVLPITNQTNEFPKRHFAEVLFCGDGPSALASQPATDKNRKNIISQWILSSGILQTCLNLPQQKNRCLTERRHFPGGKFPVNSRKVQFGNGTFESQEPYARLMGSGAECKDGPCNPFL